MKPLIAFFFFFYTWYKYLIKSLLHFLKIVIAKALCDNKAEMAVHYKYRPSKGHKLEVAEIFGWNDFHSTSVSEKVLTNLDLILGLSVPLEHDASFVPAAFVSALVTFESQMKKI